MMDIKELNKTLEFALEQGAQQVRLTYSKSVMNLTGILNGEVDKTAYALDQSLQLQLFVDGRFGTFSSNRLEEKELQAFIRSSIDTVRMLEPDENRSLPDPARLVKDVPNIVGIKEASGDISQIVKLMTLCDGNIDLYSGNDDQVVPLLSMGGIGVISVVANVAPRAMHDLCQKFFDGDVKGAAKLQRDTHELFELLFCEVNPIPVKKAVDLMGMNAGPLRMPLTEMTPANTEKLRQAMINFGIL